MSTRATRPGRAARRDLARAGVIATLLVCALPPGPARAQGSTPPDSLYPTTLRGGSRIADRAVGPRMRVTVTPSSARIGQALTYRGSVLVWGSEKVRFEPPQSGGAFTWSRIRAGRVKPGWLKFVSERGHDSAWFEARLQIFEPGRITIEGPVVQRSGRGEPASSVRLPSVRITILPTLTPADSNAELRSLHGPLRAPWWERIGWIPIIAGLALLAALFYLWRRLRRKKPAPLARPATAPAPVRARIDPAAEALRALAALRARELPQAGRFSEHAFELTAILRRFLEITVTTPRPGDTSGELLERLRSARMPEDDYGRLEGLLTLWDRVKFARAPLTEVEAQRCEEAVESFVRRVAAARAAATRAAAPAPGSPSGPPATPPAPEAA